ncbi:ribosomal protein S3, eukaryotic/archaeal [Artemisia annua]|uniref:Ribosomal protein S3, eukaryotic/archaeal n=1 Tax=Artemisia annua TaxID=35608 RepID=A0A2U1MDP2_ARTAN|nr:ribosomal protein S3, eukaryotic/archaeal [Artemisia annua]
MLKRSTTGVLCECPGRVFSLQASWRLAALLTLACYGVLRFIMENRAKGCEVIVSGKLRAQRAKSMKFKDRYMVSSGQPVKEYIDSAVRHMLLRQENLGPIKTAVHDNVVINMPMDMALLYIHTKSLANTNHQLSRSLCLHSCTYASTCLKLNQTQDRLETHICDPRNSHVVKDKFSCCYSGFVRVATNFGIKVSCQKFSGNSWSTTALDALCTSVLKYHTMNNVHYLVMTEFEEDEDEFVNICKRLSVTNFPNGLTSNNIIWNWVIITKRINISGHEAELEILPCKFEACYQFPHKDFLQKNSLGKSCALDAFCTSVLKYHTVRIVLYLTMTSFEELVKELDWEFIRKKRNQIAFSYGHWGLLHMHDEITTHVPDAVVEMEREGHPHIFCCTVAARKGTGLGIYQKRNQIAFLYGEDDHWGPLHMHDEITMHVPDVVVEFEREGHSHIFCCIVAGSVWVARHVTTLIKKNIF